MLELPSPGASHCVKRPPSFPVYVLLVSWLLFWILVDLCLRSWSWSLFMFLICSSAAASSRAFPLRCKCDQTSICHAWRCQPSPPSYYTSLQLHNNHLPAPPKPHSPRLLCQQRVVLCRFIRVALRCAEDWARLVCPREDARRNIVSRARGIPDGTLPPPPSITLCKVILPISGVSISPLRQKFQSTMVVSTYLATLWFHSHFCFFLAP